MRKYHQIFSFILLFIAAFFMSSCKSRGDFYLVIGENATKAELLTLDHLKNDLENVTNDSFIVINSKDKLPKNGLFFIIGTINSNEIIRDLAIKGSVDLSDNIPGSRGGIQSVIKLDKNQDVIVLAGSDVQGMQYAVYDYCKEVLGIDPFEYWNGNSVRKDINVDLLKLENKVISPPEIPILCYFENDVDELANIEEPKLEYDWRSYTELINSLVRVKYNAIHIFDMLGRPEFFMRPEYQKIRPDYDIRLSYIDSMINYAHDMGMMVQIDLSLGYKIKPMAQDKADCWSENKQDWIDAWKYYFEETPIAKADIFSFRPRNQVWDWEYVSSCGENKIDVFNDVYIELGNIIDKYKPDAKKILVCYSDGMDMFNNGFNPPKDWLVAWSDDGYADFDYYPESTKGYEFGTYMHAGFWLNHTVHNPYPEQLDFIMKKMVNEYGANKYCVVNGQQFRQFIINIEAMSKIADDVNAFDGESFYKNWSSRYFGEEAGKHAVNSMKALHKAQFNRSGYVQHLWEIKEAISYLSNMPIERPGKTPVAYEYDRVEKQFEPIVKRLLILDEALDEAQRGAEKVDSENSFYYDYIFYPVKIYIDLLDLEYQLHEISKNKRQFEISGKKTFLKKSIIHLNLARETLRVVHDGAISGDNNPNWQGWYSIENRRPNNGFPTFEMMDQIEENLKSLINN